MKTLFLVCGLAALIACSEGKKNEVSDDTDVNSQENVTENSGENVSPQLEYDSANRTDIDTISSAAGADKQVE